MHRDEQVMVQGLAILGESGNRLMGSPLSVPDEIKALEASMFKKTKEAEGNIVLFDEHLVIFKIVEDLCILLYAPISENEIALSEALDAFYSAVVKTIKGPLSQKSLSKHYDEVFLHLDAFIYKTVILSDSSSEMCEKVPKRTFESLEAIQIPSKFSNVLKKAHKSFATSWLKK